MLFGRSARRVCACGERACRVRREVSFFDSQSRPDHHYAHLRATTSQSVRATFTRVAVMQRPGTPGQPATGLQRAFAGYTAL